jgi:hypothetical protein
MRKPRAAALKKEEKLAVFPLHISAVLFPTLPVSNCDAPGGRPRLQGPRRALASPSSVNINSNFLREGPLTRSCLGGAISSVRPEGVGIALAYIL